MTWRRVAVTLLCLAGGSRWAYPNTRVPDLGPNTFINRAKIQPFHFITGSVSAEEKHENQQGLRAFAVPVVCQGFRANARRWPACDTTIGPAGRRERDRL